MKRVRVSGPARRDIARILRRSGESFGPQARSHYRRLLDRALRDIGHDHCRVGVRAIDEIREGYLSYHLRSSRDSARDASVRHPRHIVVFYIEESGDVVIARVFHERQMLARHLSGGA